VTSSPYILFCCRKSRFRSNVLRSYISVSIDRLYLHLSCCFGSSRWPSCFGISVVPSLYDGRNSFFLGM